MKSSRMLYDAMAMAALSEAMGGIGTIPNPAPLKNEAWRRKKCKSCKDFGGCRTKHNQQACK